MSSENPEKLAELESRLREFDRIRDKLRVMDGQLDELINEIRPCSSMLLKFAGIQNLEYAQGHLNMACRAYNAAAAKLVTEIAGIKKRAGVAWKVGDVQGDTVEAIKNGRKHEEIR